jgi:hypothetical protein
MAEYTPEERLQLRRLIGDVTEPYAYDDDAIDEMLTAADGSARSAASTYWLGKATEYSEMVDISEAGSSRKNSDLFKNAMQLAKQYDDSDGVNDPDATPPSTTRRIVRR